MHSGKVPYSANGISQNNESSSLICHQALGRPAWKSQWEEQCCHPILSRFVKPGSASLNYLSVFPALEAAKIPLGTVHVGQFAPKQCIELNCIAIGGIGNAFVGLQHILKFAPCFQPCLK